MALWLRTFAALPEDSNPVPSTHVKQFIATCNSTSRDPMPILASTFTRLTYHIHTDIHGHINKIL